jgi:hypothetical protein
MRMTEPRRQSISLLKIVNKTVTAIEIWYGGLNVQVFLQIGLIRQNCEIGIGKKLSRQDIILNNELFHGFLFLISKDSMMLAVYFRIVRPPIGIYGPLQLPEVKRRLRDSGLVMEVRC